MRLSAAATSAAPVVYRCLGTSGTLVHRRRCYEDSRLVTLADVEELLAQPGLTTWLAMDGDAVHGIATVSLGEEDARPAGHLHLFVVHPDAQSHTAVRLLHHVLGLFVEQHVALIRQARLDPLSGVFRVEQDRALLDLFAAHGFSSGAVAGNMQANVRTFHWDERLQASAGVLAASGITLRSARAGDVSGLLALNRAEGLPHWDAHLQATLAYGGLERLQVAALGGTVVGYANFFAARWDSALPEFGPLLVAASQRARGLGRVLAGRAIQFAQASGKRDVRLSTLAEHFDFYRPLGFEVTVTWHEQLWKTT